MKNAAFNASPTANKIKTHYFHYLIFICKDFIKCELICSHHIFHKRKPMLLLPSSSSLLFDFLLVLLLVVFTFLFFNKGIFPFQGLR